MRSHRPVTMTFRSRRWRWDGPDVVTGHNALTGTGGMVSWHLFGYRAHAWKGAESFTHRRRFKTQDAAKRAVARWLDKRE